FHSSEQLKPERRRRACRDGQDLYSNMEVALCLFTNTSARIAERNLRSWFAEARGPNWHARRAGRTTSSRSFPLSPPTQAALRAPPRRRSARAAAAARRPACAE